MPDLFNLLAVWWKQMLAIVLFSLAIAAAVVFIKKPEYLAVATALPGSAYATDKASIFSDNTQILYPALGTTEDLDVILGTAQLDTIYISVAEKYDLASHYVVKETGDAAIRKAAAILKSKSKVSKSEYNELKVSVWNTDRQLSPQLANAILEKVRDIHRDIQSAHNISLIKSLQSGIPKIQAGIDSVKNALAGADENNRTVLNARLGTLTAQLQQYEKLSSEYQLLADNKPEMVIIVEKARISDKPDRPKRVLVLVVTLVLSILFSLGVAMVLHKRKLA